MNERTNLQHDTGPEGVTTKSVQFSSGDSTLAGTLYRPAAGVLPAVIVTGAWTTVKEQMAGTYARELAAHGFAALAFDFSGWGESEGLPRYQEAPAQKTADIRAAAAYLAAQDDIASEQIYGLGICASSGYMASAVADDDHLSRLALIAPWLHDAELAAAIYGGEEGVAKLIELGDQASQASEPQLITAASASDESSLMYQAPYYTEEDRGLISSYDNKFDVASWRPWLTYDAQSSADRLQAPTLVICSEAAALPAGARAYVDRTQAPVEQLWLDEVNQFDFYDRSDVVKQAAARVAEHFKAEQV